MADKKIIRNAALVTLIILFMVILFMHINLSTYERATPSTIGAASSSAGNVSIGILPISICNFDLDQYWSYISLCADPDDRNVTEVLSEINYRYVMVWNNSLQGWEIYSPRAASNPFTEFEVNNSYFIYLNDLSDTVFISGNLVDDTNISLAQFWNGPSWPYDFNTSIINQTKSINDTFRYEMKWNNSFQEWEIYSPRAAVKPFTTIFKGEGKIVYIDNVTDLLIYNKSEL